MNIALWIVQGLLAALFLLTGVMKLIMPIDKLKEKATWVKDTGPGAVRLLGFVEVLGAFGIILPYATGIAPILTPITALCFIAVLIGAIILHARKKEPVLPVILFLFLSAFVAYGRF